MHTVALLMGLALGSPADAPECRNPPSRASDSYWAFIDACGCANVDAPSRASPDYERFLKACSDWRQRNPQIDVIVPETPPVNSSGPPQQMNPGNPPECGNPPSRTSDSYWAFIEACGCTNLDAPSRTSPDYDRFLKACSDWRERNPQINVIVPDTPPANSGGPPQQTNPAIPQECRNPPSRASDSYWAFIEACGCANLDAPSRTSPDYERFVKACSDWRQRNPQIDVIVP